MRAHVACLFPIPSSAILLLGLFSLVVVWFQGPTENYLGRQPFAFVRHFLPPCLAAMAFPLPAICLPFPMFDLFILAFTFGHLHTGITFTYLAFSCLARHWQWDMVPCGTDRDMAWDSMQQLNHVVFEQDETGHLMQISLHAPAHTA